MRIIISIIIVVFSLPSFTQNTLSNSMCLEAQFNLFLPYVDLLKLSSTVNLSPLIRRKTPPLHSGVKQSANVAHGASARLKIA